LFSLPAPGTRDGQKLAQALAEFISFSPGDPPGQMSGSERNSGEFRYAVPLHASLLPNALTTGNVHDGQRPTWGLAKKMKNN
jgi:hypothetical protein